MSTQQLGDDEIERRLRSLSANLDPTAPRDIYAYIRGLPDEHPIRGRRWTNPMRPAVGRPATVAAAFASVALAAIIILSLVLRSAGPSSPPAAQATPGGHFAPTGAMPEYRLGYTATLLLDGRVLIAGGFADGPDLALARPDR